MELVLTGFLPLLHVRHAQLETTVHIMITHRQMTLYPLSVNLSYHAQMDSTQIMTTPLNVILCRRVTTQHQDRLQSKLVMMENTLLEVQLHAQIAHKDMNVKVKAPYPQYAP